MCASVPSLALTMLNKTREVKGSEGKGVGCTTACLSSFV